MFPTPSLANPILKVVGPRKKPAKLLPVLKKPETLAGIVIASRLELRNPDTVLPEFARPDCSTPVFAKPELPMAPDEKLTKPELLAP
ncbi:hypothetical protein MYBA111488_17155 [Mycobacterium basiliense]